jgi:hypothetical protein
MLSPVINSIFITFSKVTIAGIKVKDMDGYRMVAMKDAP